MSKETTQININKKSVPNFNMSKETTRSKPNEESTINDTMGEEILDIIG